MTRKTIILKIRSSFWYVPSIYGIIAVLFALVSIEIDTYITTNDSIRPYIPTIFLTDLALAQTILSSISASLLTMTTITFSTILVVLTTFLSEFSPRTLQNFIKDVKTQSVLGVFVGGFVYSILVLLFLRNNDHSSQFIVPSFSVLFAIVCLLVFVFFIHYVSRWMQVSNLIHGITQTTMEIIEQDFEDRKDVHEDAPWEDWESDEIKNMTPRQIQSQKSGYILDIDVNGLMRRAIEDDCIVRVEEKISEYVDNNTIILSIWPMGKGDNHLEYTDYEKFITIGTEKAPVENIEFGLTKIVEIALRALSSGINDPNTAVNCIESLGKILAKLGGKHLPNSYHNDENHNLRIILDKLDFSDYLYESFYQIRAYGFNDISVLSAGLKALTLIAKTNPPHIKKIVWNFTEYIIEGLETNTFLTLDRNYINKQLEQLARATEHTHHFKSL